MMHLLPRDVTTPRARLGGRARARGRQCAWAEVRWHEELLNRVPKIAADFREGVGAPVTLPQETTWAGGAQARDSGADEAGDESAADGKASSAGSGAER